MIDFGQFTHLTFDCYGTLIDWETGILKALQSILATHRISTGAETLLKLYSKYEAIYETSPYRTYREVLRSVTNSISLDLGFTPSEFELNALADAVGSWKPFPDTVEALWSLKSRYKLAVISNIDDAMFGQTAQHLRVPFDAVITAQQAGSYKPALKSFQVALARLQATPLKVLHVAQSIYHDHVPAKRLGLTTVRVNRKSRLAGTGLALPAEAAPDFEVSDLASLTAAIELHSSAA